MYTQSSFSFSLNIYVRLPTSQYHQTVEYRPGYSHSRPIDLNVCYPRIVTKTYGLQRTDNFNTFINYSVIISLFSLFTLYSKIDTHVRSGIVDAKETIKKMKTNKRERYKTHPSGI